MCWSEMLCWFLILLILLGFIFWVNHPHLNKIEKHCQNLVQDLSQLYPDNLKIQKLKAKLQHTRWHMHFKSHTVNKGQDIKLCLADGDFNLLTFVALHELAHVMSDSIGHTEEFYQHFKFLLKEAAQLNYYYPIDYQYAPVKHCSHMVWKNPMF